LKKIIVTFLILLCVVIFLFQGRDKTQSKEISPTAISRAAVTVSTIENGPVYRAYTAVGTIAPEDMARIMPKVAGRISILSVDEGDRVEKGSLLMQIDSFDYKRAVENANAVKKQAYANLDKTKRDFARMERLYLDNTISEQQYNDTKTTFKIAQHVYAQTKVALKTARHNLRECNVISPISGIITKKQVNPGELTGPQVIAFIIMQMDKIKVEVDLPENAYGFLHLGNTCLVTVDAIPNDSFKGNITKIHPIIHQVSRTIRITISLDNPDLKLRSGMTARANIIQKARKDVLLVPKSAIVQGETGYFAFKVIDDMVEKTRVEIGVEGDNAFEIKKGLSLGDQAVIRGLTGLRDGMAVRTTSVALEVSENPPT
jgi:membrane fusion protein (multidrug efflux system)